MPGLFTAVCSLVKTNFNTEKSTVVLKVVFLSLSEISREVHSNGVVPKFCGKLPFFAGTVVSDRWYTAFQWCTERLKVGSISLNPLLSKSAPSRISLHV